MSRWFRSWDDEPTGRIYFIACRPMAAIKIGFTKRDPLGRLAALQTGCPAPLKLCADVPGCIEEERLLHEAFAPLQIHGEWFRAEGKLADMVGYLLNGSDRQLFEDAIHDVLMQGLWHPDSHLSEPEYDGTGDWEPFRSLLWHNFGPWEEV